MVTVQANAAIRFRAVKPGEESEILTMIQAVVAKYGLEYVFPNPNAHLNRNLFYGLELLP